jgi:hypothetical protein
MPTTVAGIFAAAGAESAGVVRLGVPPNRPEAPSGVATGIYVIALTAGADRLGGTVSERLSPQRLSPTF